MGFPNILRFYEEEIVIETLNIKSDFLIFLRFYEEEIVIETCPV